MDIDLLNELSDYIEVKIKCCNDNFHDKDWMETKSHPDYDIWYIREGSVNIIIDTTQYTAYQGDVVLFYPDQLYTAIAGEDGFSSIFVHFDMCLGNNPRILDEFQLCGILRAKQIERETKIFLDCYGVNSGIGLILKAHFMVLLTKIISCGDKGNRKKFNYLKSEQNDKLTRLEPVFKYISRNINRNIQIKELAEICQLSDKYFYSFFKSVVGISPSKYIDQIKMNLARDLLYKNEHNIKEIAAILGYSDQYSFSKAFKRYYQVPPSEFV